MQGDLMAAKSAREVARRRQKAAVLRRQKSKLKSGRKKTPAFDREIEAILDDLLKDLKDFRPLPFMQAMMQYARPLMDMSPGEDVTPASEIFSTAVSIWNYAGQPEDAAQAETEQRKLVKAIAKTFRLDKAEGKRILDMMVERREFLMPSDLQLFDPFFLVVRRDVSYLLTEFDYGRLEFSMDPVPPQPEDEAWLADLQDLDSWMQDGAEVWECEKEAMEIKEALLDSYSRWLHAKGLGDYADDFDFFAGVYLEFVYETDHREAVTLKSVPDPILEHFFSDFVLRKALTTPTKYPTCPASVIFLYSFLQDKGYMANTKSMVSNLAELEQIFFLFVKGMFG